MSLVQDSQECVRHQFDPSQSQSLKHKLSVFDLSEAKKRFRLFHCSNLPRISSLTETLAKLFHHYLACYQAIITSTPTRDTGRLIKARFTCTELLLDPKARYPASTGSTERAQIVVAWGQNGGARRQPLPLQDA